MTRHVKGDIFTDTVVLQKPSYADHQPLMSEDVPSAQPVSLRQPLTSQPNGMSKPPRSSPDEQPHLVPNRVNDLHRKASGDIGTPNSEPDSVLEYYNGVESKTGSRNVSQPTVAKGKKNGKVKGKVWTEAEKDEKNWIHRDKLKEIEIREMEEAGFRVGRASRSDSRSQSAARRDRTNSEATDPTSNGEERQETRRAISPIPAEEEEPEYEQPQWDLRTPEEIAADNEQAEREQWSVRNTHTIRPSTSRIPVAKTSPAPVPATFVERDAPLPRSRKSSVNWSGDAIATNGARVRSGSISSQVMLDDFETSNEHLRTPSQAAFGNPTSPVTGSPPKAKTPGKPAPGGRKVGVQKGQSKPRTTSATSPMKRPGTSGGSISRPTTSHRPEGEAPWIANMYKPDPRLPPDQQIIPTHAKRMQQQQWEQEGRVGSMYDTDFRLLNTEDFEDKRNSIIQPIEIEKAKEDHEWPLPSPTKPAIERIDSNVKASTNEQGGYKLTPTIPQTPRVNSRNSVSRHSPPAASREEPTRLPEPPAEQESEKSDGEENTSQVDAEEVPEVEVGGEEPAAKGQMSVLEALKGVLKLALIHDGLARGLREASKALDRRQAHMCVLNEACEEEAYKKLVVALCSEHKIPLIKVPDGKQLGEWAGLCQIDREGNPRKVVNCSCVVVRDWGEDSQERSILLNYFQTEQ
ncbi:hypothetical protein BDV95DRAFT_602866 [Massariosphaeria phaeospora]|uniref:40S ribosomal protein S12 n=1 Tax=Massariosphaeria phaeospora TaxID=100035 RepID=A0A7C8IFB0_9PLEO|nr:hypothetical protein BDV95DRAFT_602866 [Massariosphaeria phaeospora]